MSPERAPAAVARAGFVDGEAYERGRTEYDERAVAEALHELGVGPDACVLDLAAGTGKLARAVAARGLAVVAVEPQAAMRATLAARTPAVRVLDGTAEAIPLPDAAVDAVVVGDAFHWFDAGRALDEIARVLRPVAGAGGLAIFVRRPLTERLPWWREVAAPADGRRDASLGPERAHDSEPWRAALEADGRFQAPRRRVHDRELAHSAEDVVAYAASWSFVRSAPPDERERILAQVGARARAALRGAQASSLTVTWRTEVTTARLEG